MRSLSRSLHVRTVEHEDDIRTFQWVDFVEGTCPSDTNAQPPGAATIPKAESRTRRRRELPPNIVTRGIRRNCENEPGPVKDAQGREGKCKRS